MSCPICQKPPLAAYRPFCCKRCADLDLAKWLSGAYSVPIDGADEDDLPEDP
ncbi:MAG TPA: DNA gyrase inhibitor YacG, partial [Rhodobacteraceae bacterium]|nr:DNA gyrase inhibitor YacG [Paracoccaceae bacterium]